ncbi:hypothetical protein [Paenibacillus rhizophilus]|uniref:HTH LytTR-type domain-containing protein n=1 Tax=Paenibacillus rhizophilus TaxID=1850366 RepID=A0A3N9P2D6_9BACL|nr:hypothetical protein [Paenibacillus rhizophilus]RQW10381.1 hypothetical protein EH198_16320 [Paenibacillus rhizophilus]
MKIPVVRSITTGDQDKDFVEIDLVKDVKFISKSKKTNNSADVLEYHTSFGSFYSLTTLHEAKLSYLKYGFQSFDSSTLVNVSKIKETIPLDKGTKIVFTDNSYETVRKKLK